MLAPLPVPASGPDGHGDPQRHRARRHRPSSAAALGASGLAALLALVVTTTLPAQELRTVSGVVVDAESGERIPDVLVSIQAVDRQVYTDRNGRFQVRDVPTGRQRLALRHLAYGEHSLDLLVEDTGTLEFLVRISRQAIELAPLVVEAVSESERARLGSGNVLREIRREDIQAAAQKGMELFDLVRYQMPGVRYRLGPGSGDCLEYRPAGSVGDCRNMAVFLDGVLISDPTALLQTMNLDEIERLEVLSPGEAGVRYGAFASWGVLLVETRTTRVSETPANRGVSVTGFGWYESQPYRWARVPGASFLANAAAVGMSYLSLDYCMHDAQGAIHASGCPSMVIAGAGGVLTGTVGSFAAGWAGSTARSQGRAFPSLLLGTVSAATGYLLLINGETSGSKAARKAGLAVLTVGTPLLVTLSDRVFRVLH